ncbi:hypothetical protein HAX54_004882, partial [Datura stramonium]|nr:hypothetical protein [Datura stramonium]
QGSITAYKSLPNQGAVHDRASQGTNCVGVELRRNKEIVLGEIVDDDLAGNFAGEEDEEAYCKARKWYENAKAGDFEGITVGA